MGRFYKKAIVTALLVSALSTTVFAASKDNTDYENIPPEAVIVTDFNSDIFKSSAFSNYDNEHQQYRLSKYDIINVSIVGFNDSLNKSNTMGRYGYTSSAINGSVKKYLYFCLLISIALSFKSFQPACLSVNDLYFRIFLKDGGAVRILCFKFLKNNL